MKKVVMLILILGFGGGVLLLSNQVINPKDSSNQPTPKSSITKDNCLADECLLDGVEYPVGKLTKDVIESMTLGLDDEYKAFSTYQAIIDTYGPIRPFIMIARAEQQHIAALQGLFDKYAITIPENKYIGNVEVPENIQDACALGVEAEIANVKLYKEKLIPLASSYADISQVYTNLMNASEQKHLPAFMKCD